MTFNFYLKPWTKFTVSICSILNHSWHFKKFWKSQKHFCKITKTETRADGGWWQGRYSALPDCQKEPKIARTDPSHIFLIPHHRSVESLIGWNITLFQEQNSKFGLHKIITFWVVLNRQKRRSMSNTPFLEKISHFITVPFWEPQCNKCLDSTLPLMWLAVSYSCQLFLIFLVFIHWMFII